MISICESYLEQYPTTADEDDKLIYDKSLFGTLSRQQRMAVKLRVSEKRILQSTIRAVNEELARLPAVVVGDKIIPAGRSFDTLMSSKTRATEGNTASAWIEVRGEKEKKAAEALAAAKEGTQEAGKISIAERRRRRRSSE